jgi:hypothetical protein
LDRNLRALREARAGKPKEWNERFWLIANLDIDVEAIERSKKELPDERDGLFDRMFDDLIASETKGPPPTESTAPRKRR